MLARQTSRLVIASTSGTSHAPTSSLTAGSSSVRRAHLSPSSPFLASSSPYSAVPPPAPTPSPSPSPSPSSSKSGLLSTSTAPSISNLASTANDDPTWSDPKYVARYRDPRNHDRPFIRASYVVEGSSGTRRGITTSTSSSTSTASTSTSASSSSAPARNLSPPPISTYKSHRPTRPTSTSDLSSDLASRDDFKRREKQNESPRHRRLEMERAWSGGEASPPIPTELRTGRDQKRPNYALLYPGSGSQYPLMASFLKNYKAAQNVWKEAEASLAEFEPWRKSLKLDQMEGQVGELGKLLERDEERRKVEPSLHAVVFDGGQEELTRASNAQPAILVTSIAFLRTLEQDFGLPIAENASAILGHSSGEYSAAVASGAVEFADAVKLIRLHGMLTTYALSLPSINLSSSADTAPARVPQMSAVVLNPGHSHDEVVRVVKQVREERTKTTQGCAGTVEVASFNSSAQIVLSGSREGIMAASERLREEGIASRAADLPVSAPFHCSFLQPAADGMRRALEATELKNPKIPLVSNLDGTMINTTNSLVSNLVAQIALPVRWSNCIHNLSQDHIDRLIFLGPGKALANLARRDATLREKRSGQKSRSEVLSIATDDDLKAFAELWAEESVE